MKKLLLLGLAVLGLSACTPSANPINNDPNQDPTQNPAGKDENLSLNISASFTAPRNGGLIEIPVEYEGEYVVMSQSIGVHVVRSKAMQKGVIVVSVQPNLSEEERKMRLTVRYVSTIKPGGSLDHAEKNVEITQKPVAKEVLFADIAGANALYIAAEQGGVSKAASSAQRLYKVAATGAVDSVVFKDEYGDTATVKVNYIRNLSGKYVYMNLTTEPRNVEKQYVVRKTDGAVFAAKPPYITRDTKIQTDHMQNVYYVAGYPAHLYKMYNYNNGVDIARLTKDNMAGVNPSSFCVDQRGNVLFSFSNSTIGGVLCYTASGEYASWGVNENLKLDYPVFALPNEPENFYSFTSNSTTDITTYERYKCTIPAMTREVVETLKYNGKDFWYRSYYVQGGPYVFKDMVVLLVTPDIMVSPSWTYPLTFLRAESDKRGSAVPLSRTDIVIIKELRPANGFLYGYNSDEIYRIDINTGQVETLYADKEYSIYDFSVGADNVLTFSALELRKAQDVLCEIRGGQLKILKADDSQKIIQLERIN